MRQNIIILDYPKIKENFKKAFILRLKKMRGVEGVYFVVSIFIIIALASFTSANVFDSLKELFSGTGQASSGPQNVSVQVAGVNFPTVSFVQNINGGANVIPIENGIRNVVFSAQVTDADGVGNINDSSVDAEFRRGIVTRIGNCSLQSDLNANTANYSCSVNMFYYDGIGSWTANVSARDQESNYAENTSELFTYQELKAFIVPLSPSTLNWPILTPGAVNRNSSNDPTFVNNTGNYAGNIFLTGFDLVGQTNPSENISINRFNVSGTSGSECTGGVSLGPNDGNSANTLIPTNPGPSGGSSVYYCITSVPIVSSQVYSTSIRGPAFSWIIFY